MADYLPITLTEILNFLKKTTEKRVYLKSLQTKISLHS